MIKVLMILMLLSSTAWAAEDCNLAWEQGVTRHYGEQAPVAYHNCRIANALELIAEKMGEGK